MYILLPYRAARPGWPLLRAALVMVVSVLMMAGCASAPTLRAEVTRFHQSELQPPRTFTIGTASPRAASLEYRSYAQLILDQLLALGFVETGAEAARYRVEFDYQATADAQAALDYWAPYGPAFGWGWGPYRPGPYRWPAYPGPSWGAPMLPVAQTVTLWTHTLRLSMVEVMPPGGAPPQTVFESNARARALEPGLPALMPGLVQAVFQAFPGPNGSTEIVEVPLKGPSPQPMPVNR